MAEETANEHGFVETPADGEHSAPKSSVLRLRGLPFSAGEDDVRTFFADFDVVTVVIGKRAGRSTGEGYVQLDSVAAAADAIAKLHRQTLGHRYIEVFESTEADLATAKSLSVDRMRGFVIRCRGLPYTSTAQDVLNFFGPDVPIVRGIEGVVFTYAPDGRPTGEAFVELQTEEAQREALKKHKESLGSRYIELFVSTKVDMIQAIQQNRMILGYSNRKRWLQQQGINVGPGGGGPNGHHGGYGGGGPHHGGPGGHYGGGGPGGHHGGARGGSRHHQQHYGNMDEVTDMMSGFNMGGHVQMIGPGGQMLPPGTYQLEVTRDGKQRFGGGYQGGGRGGGRGGRGGPGGPYGGGRGGGMMMGGGRGMGQGYHSRPPPPGGVVPMPPMPPAARQTAQVVQVPGGSGGNAASSSGAAEGQGQPQQQQQQQAVAGGQQQQQHQQQQYMPYEQQQWAQMVPPPPGGGAGQPAPGLYGSAGGAQQAPGIQGVAPGAYTLTNVIQVPAGAGGGAGGYPDYMGQGLDGGAAAAGLQATWGPR
ncbi:hypothetical protein HYH02_007105 [Chlamydomonas schloesseri]|uniref:RRM domain-containing protein n=1 Tax=Chlamydomonas schloesseri TaxID=2026947 RepID=A0A835WJN3_9CHLO|nr:hypothetical protein HYH02_007105 [Chlamydomonas schloesseri]|eukprot:KAG2448080.1 hypothetical protein HYH02_007105 [Chlamydomonas schloesseri]